VVVGTFVSRMKQNANPTIVADRYPGPGRKRPLVGIPRWDTIAGLGREELDVDVEISYRAAKGRPTGYRASTRPDRQVSVER
jgi:hypothetical protein